MFQVGWLLYLWLMFGWMVMRTHLGQRTQNYQLATSWTVQKHTPWYCLISQPMRWHQWMFTSWARSSWQSSIHRFAQLDSLGDYAHIKFWKETLRGTKIAFCGRGFLFSPKMCMTEMQRKSILVWASERVRVIGSRLLSLVGRPVNFVSTRSKNLKGVFEMWW